MSELAKEPARLFRYFSPAQSHIFEEKKLWFSSVKDFNDIFEVVPRFDQLIEELVDGAFPQAYQLSPIKHLESYEDFKNRILNTNPTFIRDYIDSCPDTFQDRVGSNYGILCFSEHLDSLLMWGHYTDCHRGFVIEFDPGHELFLPRDFGKVIYEQERPMARRNADARMLLCKSPEWVYEDEHRLIKLKSDLTPGKRLRYGKEIEGHFCSLPMDAVKAVYFGCRILADDRNKLLKATETLPLINCFNMKRNQIEYKLDAVPIKRK